MSMANPLAIRVEIPMIDIMCYLEKEFIELIHINPLMVLLEYEVDNFLKFWSKHQMQRNSLNQIFKTLRHQEKIILSSNMYEKTYL